MADIKAELDFIKAHMQLGKGPRAQPEPNSSSIRILNCATAVRLGGQQY